jgi:hypothetical protein
MYRKTNLNLKNMKTVGIIFSIILFLSLMWGIGKVMGVVDKTTEPEHIINSYEEYEEIYSTCNKLCDDISNYKNMEVDKTSGFSKQERILNLETQLNRWIREYNAKSRMITKNMWKSNKLPYQLKRSDFICGN